MAFYGIEPEVPAGAALGRRMLQEVLAQLVLLRRHARLLLLLHHDHLRLRLQRDLKRWRRAEGGGVWELLERGVRRREGKRDLKATCKIGEVRNQNLTTFTGPYLFRG